MSEPTHYVYHLSKPVTLSSGKVIDKINIRRKVKVKDWKTVFKCGASQETAVLYLVPVLAGLTDAEWDEFETEDMNSIVEIVSIFLGDGPQTGTTSSQSSQPNSTSQQES